MAQRGGRRQGRTGAKYSNRSDLQTGARLPVQAASGQAYGERGKQEAAQKAVPLLRSVPPGGAPPAGAGQAASPVAPPPPPGPIDGPTERPDEPLTAGANMGPGPGVAALGLGAVDTTGDELRALYQAFPNNDLRALIEALDA